MQLSVHLKPYFWAQVIMQAAMVHNRWKELQFEPYDDEENDNVMQCGGHTLANRSKRHAAVVYSIHLQ